MPVPVLSVVVPMRTVARDQIQLTLRSLAKQTLPGIDVIVVDQNETPESAWAVEEFLQGTTFRLLRAPGASWQAAVNRGFEEVRGTAWSYLCDDVMLMPDAYERLLRCLVSHGRTAVHGPFLCTPPARQVCSGMGVAHVVSTEFQRSIGGFGEEVDAEARMWRAMEQEDHIGSLPLPLTAFCYRRFPRAHVCRQMRRRTDFRGSP